MQAIIPYALQYTANTTVITRATRVEYTYTHTTHINTRICPEAGCCISKVTGSCHPALD